MYAVISDRNYLVKRKLTLRKLKYCSKNEESKLRNIEC